MLSNGTRLLTLTGRAAPARPPRAAGRGRARRHAARRCLWVPLVLGPQLLDSEVAHDQRARRPRRIPPRKAAPAAPRQLRAPPRLPEVSAVLGARHRRGSPAGRRCVLRVSRSTGWSRFRTEAAALAPSGHARSGREVELDSTVEAICRRLDGLPLAVELAAARTAPRSRAPPRTPRLGSSPPDGRRPRATAPAHPPRDDRVGDLARRPGAVRLSRCSQAASRSTTARCIDDADLDGLAALVDYSLLKTVGDDRFLMLETIREYALERLVDAGGGSRRHAQYFAAVAEEAYARRFDAEAEWSARLDVDHDEPLDWLKCTTSTPPSSSPAGTRLVLALPRAARGARGRLSDALSASDAGRLSRARALTGVGALGPAWGRRAVGAAARGGGRAMARAGAGTSSPRPSIRSAGLSSTTPATRPRRWRRSKRPSRSAASSAMQPARLVRSSASAVARRLGEPGRSRELLEEGRGRPTDTSPTTSSPTAR